MACNSDDALAFMNPSMSLPIAVADGDGYLLDSGSAFPIENSSGSFQCEGFLGGIDGGGGDSAFGFSRPDFRQSPLVGTVQHYDRHVFLCYKDPKVWPSRIEAAEFDRLPRLLSAALLARKADMNRKTALTICEGHDGTETSNGDVLIFPDMIRYRRLTHFDVDTFVEEALVRDGEWLPGTPESLRGWYIFVCCHGSRDRRCGTCGPAILNRFKEEIELHGVQGKVHVRACSHIGGHKYAGNVIIFGSTINSEVTGHWYGYVMPDDVPFLLKQHIGKGEIVDFLWRGQMGLSEEEQKKSLELRFVVNEGTDIGVGTKSFLHEKDLCFSQGEREALLGCCQNNGDNSCHNRSLGGKLDDRVLGGTERKLFAEKKSSSKKQISHSNHIKKVHARRVCTITKWFESWECEDTYAALAVLSAVTSVALAYSCYKQLK